MLWIGITGPIGGGKSTVSELLRQQGYAVLDADAVVHKLLSPGGSAETAVFKTFGEKLKNPQGTLDRRALGQLVFSDPAKLKALEDLLHPMVRSFVAKERKKLAAGGHLVAFYDVPLLFEKNMQDQFDSVIVVTASEQKRCERFKKRTGLSEAEFMQRNQSQLPADKKAQLADAVILNEGHRDELSLELARALGRLKIPSPGAS